MHTLELALLFLIVLFPIADLFLEKHKFNSKSAEYVKSAAMLWAVTGFLLYCFFEGNLSVASPQVLPTVSWKGWSAIALFVVFIAYLVFVIISMRKNPEVRKQVLDAFNKGGDSLNDILPSSWKEYMLFTALVSVSAGLCEELIFRWYVFNFIDVHAHRAVALVVSSLLFGIWHLYLGWQHVIKSAVVGALLCGLYIYTESILIVIVAHILMDIYSGTVAIFARQKHT